MGDATNGQNQQATPAEDAAVDIERYLSGEEIAALVSVKPRTVEQWVAERRVPFYRVGRSVRFRWSEVEKYLATHCRVGARTDEADGEMQRRHLTPALSPTEAEREARR